MYIEFEDDTKLGGAVDSLKGREALQRDLDKLERWAINDHVKFSNSSRRILHLGQGNPGCMCRMWTRGWRAAWQKGSWSSC